MAKNELEIRLIVKDELTKALKKAETQAGKSTGKMKQNFVDLAAKVYILRQALTTFFNAINGFVEAASKVEQFRTRLEVLFKSVDEGNKVFASMAKLASQVPKTYEEIMESATQLAGVVKNGTKEIEKLMPIIVDISAGTGLGVQEVTGQMIRMYSAGAASADMFRERGISAALGFKAGVSYTAKETMDIITKQWEDGTGKFTGASKELAKTWEGTMSMLNDAWFKFNKELGEFIIKSPTVLKGIEQITYALGWWAESIDKIGEWFAQDDLGEGLMANLQSQLKDVNEQLDIATKLVGMMYVPNREGIEEKINELLEQKTRILLTIAELQERQIVNEEDLRIVIEANSQVMATNYQAYAGQLTQLKTKYEDIEKVIKKIENSFSTALSSLITGTSTAKEAFTELGKSMLKMIADMIAQWIVSHTIGAALRKAAVASSMVEAAALAQAWMPAAVFANIATAGGASIAGSAGMVSFMGLAQGMSAAMQLSAQATAATPMAEGGIVTKPTFAMIGEAGPEAVIPLDRAGGMGDINITVNGNIEKDNINRLVEEIGYEIERNLRYSRSI